MQDGRENEVIEQPVALSRSARFLLRSFETVLVVVGTLFVLVSTAALLSGPGVHFTDSLVPAGLILGMAFVVASVVVKTRIYASALRRMGRQSNVPVG